MWYESEMVLPPLALEMSLFERNKVIEEPLQTDSGSVEFSLNREGRKIDRKEKKNISCTIFLSVRVRVCVCVCVGAHLPLPPSGGLGM